MNSTKWRKIITCILALTLLAGCSVSDSLGITTHSAQDVEIPAADQERFSMLSTMNMSINSSWMSKNSASVNKLCSEVTPL